MRQALCYLGLGLITSGTAIITVVTRNGADMAALASMASIATGSLMFLASRAFKSRERA